MAMECQMQSGAGACVGPAGLAKQATTLLLYSIVQTQNAGVQGTVLACSIHSVSLGDCSPYMHDVYSHVSPVLVSTVAVTVSDRRRMHQHCRACIESHVGAQIPCRLLNTPVQVPCPWRGHAASSSVLWLSSVFHSTAWRHSMWVPV